MKASESRYLTKFIGRQREVAELRGLLARRRLVALTGPSGKTRLALEAAGGLEEEFPDGIWFIELAELTEPSLVPQAVASALGLREVPDRSLLENLTHFLRERRSLLLFDNCEHLLDACASLAAALLQDCPDLHLLATGREALGLSGETVRPMLPLDLPASTAEPAELSQVESVALFIDRAASLLSDFSLTKENASSIAHICRLLDGIPHAIELAAACIPVLDVSQIANRLHDSLRLLMSGPRWGAPRYQTMRAAIDWSYALLSEEEQTLWRRLSVFRGSFSLEAVEAVCGQSNPLELITQLVNKSLVVVLRGEGETRCRLLEPLRQYAAEKLEEAGETDTIRQNHCEYYLAWAEENEIKLHGPEQLAWLEQFDVRYSNLRTALAWSLQDAKAPKTNLRFVVAMSQFWSLRNMLAEGRRWLEESLSQPGTDGRIPERVQALCLAGILTFFQGDYATARNYTEEAHSLARSLEFVGQWGLGYALMMRGQIVRFFGERESALKYLNESVSHFREIEDRWGLAVALSSLGEVSVGAGDLKFARKAFQESQSFWHAVVGDPWGIALNMHQFAFLACQEGDYAIAKTLFTESNLTFEALGDTWHIAHAHRHLGDLARRRGDHAAAASLYRLCLPLFQKLDSTSGEAAAFSDLAAANSALGYAGEAASCLHQALMRLQRLPNPSGAAPSIRALADAAGKLGKPQMAARLLTLTGTQKGGSSNTVKKTELYAALLSDLVVEAQQLVLDIHREEATPPISDLTSREIEVLRLIADGLTNRQIAERLVISQRTNNAHLRSIYKKLEVNTRTAAARIVIEQNLR